MIKFWHRIENNQEFSHPGRSEAKGTEAKGTVLFASQPVEPE